MCVNLVVLRKWCEKLRCFPVKYTHLEQILHDRRSWRSRQISTLCPSQFPLLSINLKSHNILDQCAGAIQAQCGEPVEGGSSYRPLRRTGDELNFWSWIDDDNDNYGNIFKIDKGVSFTIRSQMNLDIKSSMDLRLEQTAALKGLQDHQHLQKQPSMSMWRLVLITV